MKKLILSIFLMLLTLNVLSQTTDSLPQFYVQNGDTIGIIISVSQSQKIDNDEELLGLFQGLQINCDSIDAHYVLVINDENQQIALLQLKSDTLQAENSSNDTLINNLKTQIVSYQYIVSLDNSQLKNDSTIIKDLKKELVGQKIRKIISYIGNGVLASTLIMLIVINHL